MIKVERQWKYPNLLRGNPNNKGGRPTKYNSSFIIKAEEYLNDIEKKRPKILLLPTIEEFADLINVDHDTLINWTKKKLKDTDGNKTDELAYPEFFGAYKRIMSYQRYLLKSDGFYMGKRVNASFAIFLLKVNHGMSVKHKVQRVLEDDEIEEITDF